MNTAREQLAKFISDFKDCFTHVEVRIVAGKKDNQWRNIYSRIELLTNYKLCEPIQANSVIAIQHIYSINELDFILNSIGEGFLRINDTTIHFINEKHNPNSNGIEIGSYNLNQYSIFNDSQWGGAWMAGRGARSQECMDRDVIAKELPTLKTPYCDIMDLLSEFTGYERSSFLEYSSLNLYAPIKIKIDNFNNETKPRISVLSKSPFTQIQSTLSIIAQTQSGKPIRKQLVKPTSDRSIDANGLTTTNYSFDCKDSIIRLEIMLTIRNHIVNTYRWDDNDEGYRDNLAGIVKLSEIPSSPVNISPSPISEEASQSVFIVHGRDETTLKKVERFVKDQGLEPKVLYKQASGGKTIIEKFEEFSNVGFAIVLLTPDDYGYYKKAPTEVKARARQNVILELGYFFAKLGRKRVCALMCGDVEMPSDIHGIIWVDLDDDGHWRDKLASEMKDAEMNF